MSVLPAAGSIVYTLSRTVDENLSFYLYSEWDGQKAVAEHFNSSYLKEYLKTIADLNVVSSSAVLHDIQQCSMICQCIYGVDVYTASRPRLSGRSRTCFERSLVIFDNKFAVTVAYGYSHSAQRFDILTWSAGCLANSATSYTSHTRHDKAAELHEACSPCFLSLEACITQEFRHCCKIAT